MNTPLEPCPFASCDIQEPHRHPSLGENMVAPRPRPDMGLIRSGKDGLEHITVTLAQIPLICPRCQAESTGPAFLPLRDGETRRDRVCDQCGDKAEHDLTERFQRTLTIRAPRTLGSKELPRGSA